METTTPRTKILPDGYIAIGVPGAAPGTAYENYAVDPKGNPYFNTPMWPFATGVVQEDPNGNYNFESSDILEYWVDPRGLDAASNRTGSVTIGVSGTDSSGPYIAQRYLRPDCATANGGYWLLIFNRHDMSVVNNGTGCGMPAIAPPSPADQIIRYPNCGTIYNTGDLTDLAARTQAYNQLTAALGGIGPYQIGILTTFGLPAYGDDIWQITANASWYTDNGSPEGVSNGYDTFREIIENLGGSPRATLFYDFSTQTLNANPAYTFIFGPNIGDPLAGNAVVSASAYAKAGQTGYVHGTLARNLNGLYQPYQSSQQADATDDRLPGRTSP